MPTDLSSRIEALATTFATSVLAAIRGASLEDLGAVGGHAPVAKRGPGRPRKDAAQTAAVAAPASTPVKRGRGRPRKNAAPARAVSAPPAAPAKRGPGRPKKAAVSVAPTAAPKKVTKSGRLVRRSQAQIEQTLGDIVALVKKKPGLRSEQIRAALGLEAKEMPRILATGLDSKRLTKKGEKRATAYSAR